MATQAKQTEGTSRRALDWVFLLAALIVLGAGVIVFYRLPEDRSVLRLLAALMGIVLAVALVLLSSHGRTFIAYVRASVREAEKVAWPTGKEALQMTGIVFIFVTILSACIWTLDKGLEWVFYDLFLGRV